MRSIVEAAHDAVRGVLRPGETAVDATAGNGHDAVFLSRLVGPTGCVYAIDISHAAIHSTRSRLAAAGCANVVVVAGDHAHMADLLPPGTTGTVGAVMFNLGYRPHGDKSFVTSPTTTLPGLRHALAVLRPGGVLTVVAYRGHPAGSDEANAVRDWFSESETIVEEIESDPANPRSPTLLVVRKNGVEGLRGCQ